MDLVLAPHTSIRTEIEVKRSRFITALVRVDSEAQARAVVAAERAAYPDARHHCIAYVIGVPGAEPLRRSSDDGEPSGTAGRPMLETLVGAGVTDIVAVVTRYFGGTLLGTGGLVRAYGAAVQGALNRAHLFVRRRVPAYAATLPHASAGRYLAAMAAAGFATHTSYDAAGVRIRVATSRPDELAALLAEQSSGRVELAADGEETIEEPAHQS